jgi:hypothetical protein
LTIKAHDEDSMPRSPRRASTDSQPSDRRRRTSRTTADPIVDRITRLVAQNQSLQREVADLRTENAHLRGQLDEIGSALGRLSSGRRGRRGASASPTAAPPRKRKPITDPVVLEKRRQALALARAARAERLAAARAAASQTASGSE